MVILVVICMLDLVTHIALPFRALAETYAEGHSEMAKPHRPCDMTSDDSFFKQGGITNGAAWYSVEGGMCTALCVMSLFRSTQTAQSGEISHKHRSIDTDYY